MSSLLPTLPGFSIPVTDAFSFEVNSGTGRVPTSKSRPMLYALPIFALRFPFVSDSAGVGDEADS